MADDASLIRPTIAVFIPYFDVFLSSVVEKYSVPKLAERRCCIGLSKKQIASWWG
ncbi:hypothetical protein [Buttiauxella izardii]|uniref:hypothetical protein n=1 Tax=Buttiauxella izardii TaxID=82991 RepID=UPI00142DE5CE|nr:hypothetical protein [Buttiauxella izardii]